MHPICTHIAPKNETRMAPQVTSFSKCTSAIGWKEKIATSPNTGSCISLGTSLAILDKEYTKFRGHLSQLILSTGEGTRIVVHNELRGISTALQASTTLMPAFINWRPGKLHFSKKLSWWLHKGNVPHMIHIAISLLFAFERLRVGVRT